MDRVFGEMESVRLAHWGSEEHWSVSIVNWGSFASMGFGMSDRILREIRVLAKFEKG